MMQAERTTSERFFPWLVLVIALVRALPDLIHAWGHDVYSKGGGVAAIVWCAAPVLVNVTGGRAQRDTIWWKLSLLAGMGGAMLSFHVLDHVALALALFSFSGSCPIWWFWRAAAAAWLPGCGWFLSRLVQGGLSGWERPTAALLATSAVLLSIFLNSRTDPSHDPI